MIGPSSAFTEARISSFQETRLAARKGNGVYVIEARSWAAVGPDPGEVDGTGHAPWQILRAAVMSKSMDALGWGQVKTITWDNPDLYAGIGPERITNGNQTGNSTVNILGKYSSSLIRGNNLYKSIPIRVAFRTQIRTFASGWIGQLKTDNPQPDLTDRFKVKFLNTFGGSWPQGYELAMPVGDFDQPLDQAKGCSENTSLASIDDNIQTFVSDWERIYAYIPLYVENSPGT